MRPEISVRSTPTAPALRSLAQAGVRFGPVHAVWFLVLAYACFFGLLTVQRHDAFLTSAWDLGNYDQAIWNTAHGRFFEFTNMPGVTTRLAHHVEPILLLIAPLYWIWSDPRLLLWLQAVVVALGAVPLYWFARRRVGGWPAVGVAAAYLLSPPLQGANLFDFHAVTLAPTFLLFALNWLDESRDVPFLVAAGLAASTKEEIGLIVAAMGLYSLLVQRRRFGWIPLLGGAAWSALAIGVIVPHFNPAGDHAHISRYSHLGEGLGGVLATLLTRPWTVLALLSDPDRHWYLVRLLLPAAGLSLLAPEILLLALPSLAINLLSNIGPMYTLVGYHYPAPIIPFVLAAAAVGAARLVDFGLRILEFAEGGRGRDRGQGVERRAQFLVCPIVVLLATSLAVQAQDGATPLSRKFVWPIVDEHDRIGAAVIAAIPPDAAVSAGSRPNPHVSQRRRVYQFPEVGDADLVLLDVSILDLFMHPNDIRAHVEALLEQGWGVEAARDGWLLLGRNTGASVAGSPPQLPDEFYSFTRLSRPPQPQFRMEADFGDAVRLLGYDFVQTLDGPRLTTYWTALRPLGERSGQGTVHLWPFFLDPDDGRVLEDTSLRPLIETLWYPPERWRPGEIVRTTTIPWEFGDDYTVAVGVRAGEAWLPFKVLTSDVVPQAAPGFQAVALLEVRDGRPIPAFRLTAPPTGLTLREASVGPLSLHGYRIEGGASPGSDLRVTLAWQAGSASPEADYTVFVQLLDADGRLVAQSDSQPAGSSRPTSGWAPNEVVLDTHVLALPGDLAPGDYRLIAGMYDLARGGERLQVIVDGERAENDAVPLGTVKVRAP